MTSERSVAAWTGPAALGVLATYVFGGEPGAPLLTLLVVAAPCMALLRARDTLPVSIAHAVVAIPGLAAMLAANAAVVAEFARLHAMPPLLAPALIVAITLAALVARRPAVWRMVAGVGVAAVLAPPVVVAVVTGPPPWRAWQQVASRPALVFAERSEWVTVGRAVVATTTIAFDEPHQLTAVTPAVWHVTERTGARAVTRERRLGAGDAVMFRPGDELTVPAGAHLKFEPRKRVPGAATSGAAWADSTERRGWRGALRDVGAALALIGAALALVPPVVATRGSSALAVVMPFVLASTAVVIGVYGMCVAPDIALNHTAATVLHDLPAAALGGARGAPLVAMVGVGVLALYAASAAAMHDRLATALARVAPPIVRGVWVVIAVVGAVAAWLPTSAIAWFWLGAGLLASLWTAPALAVDALRRHPGEPDVQ